MSPRAGFMFQSPLGGFRFQVAEPCVGFQVSGAYDSQRNLELET